ncbi:MAG TPA: rubrerythrin family protein [bacterium]|nr:rubrerythrin family protein [bacterium]HPV65765.1 rubrerythrin family protein [bacterium]
MLGPKTKKNLEEAFAGESMARNKYDYFASAFKKAGYVQIANIFEETARNEKEHAKLWAKALGYIHEDIKDNLKSAIEGENYEHTSMYPRMEKEALEEGHEDIAKLFREVGEVEEHHEKRYKKLLENIEKDIVFKRSETKKWKCNNCGYIHEGGEAPDKCPACSHPQAYFEIFIETY